jgi:hypothetical protein
MRLCCPHAAKVLEVLTELNYTSLTKLRGGCVCAALTRRRLGEATYRGHVYGSAHHCHELERFIFFFFLFLFWVHVLASHRCHELPRLEPSLFSLFLSLSRVGTYTYVCVYMYTHMYTSTRTYTYVYTQAYKHTTTCVCVCVCVFVCVWQGTRSSWRSTTRIWYQ